MTSARTAALALAGLAAVAACNDDHTATIVTLRARPAVRTLASVEITLANANATLGQTFDLRGVSLPATFSVSTPGRTGELQISAVAKGTDGAEAALGKTTATITPDQVGDATLVLDPTDFAVNTAFAGAQRLAFIAGNNARQIAATPTGEFTIAFSDDGGGLDRFDVWGRTFDVRGVPQRTAIAAGDSQYNFNRSDVFGNDPAIAVGASGNRIAVFSSGTQLFCSAVGADGAAVTAAEVVLATGPAIVPTMSVGQPSIASIAAKRYAVAWAQLIQTGASTTAPVVKAVIVDDACAAQPGTEVTVSLESGTIDRPSITGIGTRYGVVWGNGESLRGRFTGDDGKFPAATRDLVIVADTGGSVWGQQLVASDEGYLLAYSAAAGGAADGQATVRLRRLSRTGTLQGVESIIASDLPVLVSGPAVTRRYDGALGVAWHVCTIPGDPECGIRARLARGTGLPVGDAFAVNTTTAGVQTDPSIVGIPDGFVVAWTDSSKIAPDTSEDGIRARVVYPPFEEAIGVLGARCGGEFPTCGDDLACLAGSDGLTHCHAACDPTASPACPDGGVCTTTAGTSGCIF